LLNNIHIIKTGGEKTAFQVDHANDFIRYSEIGIGFYKVGDISKKTEDELLEKVREKYEEEEISHIKCCLLRFRDKIKGGDLVIAYRSPNTIVAVGRITSGYFFDERRKRDSEEGLGLPHRRKVEWIEGSQNISRYELPDYVSKRAALPSTFITINYDSKEIEKIFKI